MAGTNPAAAPRAITERTHQLWITPHGVLRAAQRNNATVARQGKTATLKFAEPGRFSATARDRRPRPRRCRLPLPAGSA